MIDIDMSSQTHHNNQSYLQSYQVHNPQIRPVIERGASWSYNETRILLSLWGQDMVQRQLTNSKRTRHVWEKIAERIREHGFDRTADQVRTRVFNMIAEYRRILKNPTPERKKKCIFFDALNKIYQAKDSNAIKMALNNYEEEYNFEPIEFNNTDDNMDGTNDNDDGGNSGTDGEDKSEIFAYSLSPSATLNNNVVNTNGNNVQDYHSNEDSNDNIQNDDIPIIPPSKRFRTDGSINQSQYQTMNSLMENSSSALLIDRMFAHLSKETEVMREWVGLERERLAQEVSRRKEENERDERREKALLQHLMRMQEQMLNFLSKQQLLNPAASVTSGLSLPVSPSHSTDPIQHKD
ncbi:uncharacterized protein LOC128959597 [Oppia nitens]|uniref:uncharacterized protein LOC128959597 n=1 Tax=Oppia nitens TaxID=1686743 RepID=UPI0023DC619D|nr:uncharacterized protein LOC128959597 [Oppia nitens]XP_054161568.1 uncharacterized protein LOC128959597 [Oppia nitens]